MLPKRQKGFIHLGILGVLLLVGAVAVGARLVSNPDLIFNIAEKAKAPEGREACEAAGCPWEWKNRKCKKTEKNCGGGGGANSKVEECVSLGGQCLDTCAGSGLVNSSGGCNKETVCCKKRVPDEKPDEPDGECAVGEADQTVSCSPGAGCSTGEGEKRQECANGKWVDKSVGGCSCTGSPSGGSSPYCSDFMKNDCRQESKDCEPTSTGGKCVAKTLPPPTDPYCSPFMSNDCRAEGKKCEPTTSGGKCVDKTIGPGGYHCEKVSGKEYSVPANPSRADPAQPCGYGCIASTGRCRTGQQAREERAGKTWYRCIANFSIENGYNQYGDAYIGNIDFCGGSWCDKTTGRCSTTPRKENGEPCSSYLECKGRHCIDRADDSIDGPVCQF